MSNLCNSTASFKTINYMISKYYFLNSKAFLYSPIVQYASILQFEIQRVHSHRTGCVIIRKELKSYLL